jgi:hypothetical protein
MNEKQMGACAVQRERVNRENSCGCQRGGVARVHVCACVAMLM